MTYKCKKCGFIHEGEMPDGYYCPLCHASFFEFRLINEEEPTYNRVYIAPDHSSINRIHDKCINCGACSNTCKNRVGIHYKSEEEPICINCGQCVLTCPTGSLTPKYDYQTVWELINVPGKIVVVMTSPAVRVGLGDAFDYSPGEFLEGKMIASLKALGFDYVFDTNFGADLTVVEEVAELAQRIENKTNLPLFSSCCPSWVKYLKIFHPELQDNLSTCKSPIGMQATVIKEFFAKEEGINSDDLIVVALTPCTAKKQEILDGDCDYVMTTSELALLLREQNINFKELKNAKYDLLDGSSSIFGATGGVTLSALRAYYHQMVGKHLPNDLVVIREKEFYQEYSVKIKKDLVKCAVVYGMQNVEKLLPILNEFTFVEVMNCRHGCIGGGGQVVMPIKDMPDILAKRIKGIKATDKKDDLMYAYENPAVINLYEDYLGAPLSEKSHKLLHYK